MNKNELIVPRDLLNYVEDVIELDYGSQSAFAKANGLSKAYVNDILRGRRDPGQKFLDCFGIEKVTAYKFKSTAQQDSPELDDSEH